MARPSLLRALVPRHLWSIIVTAVALTALGCAGEASFRGPAAAASADGAPVSSDAGVAKTLGTYRGCGDRRYLARNGCGDDDSARAYYDQVGAKTLTLSAWQQRAFGGSLQTCLVADGQPVGAACAKLVSGIYRNAAEIGLWGELVCTATVGRDSGGCLVRYWAAEGDRDRGIAPLSTLAMDVGASGSARFYSFAQDGTVSPSAALDNEGPKHLPDSCTNCHGGSFDGATSALGSVFRELSPEYLVASSQQTLEQAQSDWYAVNRAIQSANQALSAPAGARAAGLIDELYAAPPVHRSAEQLLPASWQAGPAPLEQAKRELWTRVVAPYCAGCHRAGKLDFTDYQVFATLAGQVGGKSLLRRSLSGDGLAVMPQSQRLADSLTANAQAQSAIDAWLAAAQPIGGDTQAPLSLARLQSAPGGASLEVAVVASDNVGVARVQLQLDGQLVFEQRYDAPDLTRSEVFEIKPTAPGAKALEIVVIDAADNKSSARVTLSAGAGAAVSAGDGGAGQADAGASALDSGTSDTGAAPVTPRAQPDAQPEYGYTCAAAPGTASAPWTSAAVLLALLTLARVRRRRRRGCACQRRSRRRHGAVALICALGVVIGAAGVARAKTNGVAGHSGKVAALTCALAACHSDALAVQTIAVVGSNTAEVGELVRLTLDVTDAASSATGVGIAASGGSLVPDAASGLVALGAELVHAQPGTSNSWTFDFKADKEGTYTIYAAAILGDGDQSAGGDRFGMASFVINVGAGATAPQQPQPQPTPPNSTPAGPTGGTPPGPGDDEIVYGGCSMAPRASWPSAGLGLLLMLGLLAAARRRDRVRWRRAQRAAGRLSLALVALLLLWTSSSAAAARKRVVVLSVSGPGSVRLAKMIKRHLAARHLVIRPRTLRRLCRERGEGTVACRRHFRVVGEVRARIEDAQLTVSVLDYARRATAWGRVDWQAGGFYSRATRALRLVRRGLTRALRLVRPVERARRAARAPRARRAARAGRARRARALRAPRARRAARRARRGRVARDRFVFSRPVLVRRSLAPTPRRVAAPRRVTAPRRAQAPAPLSFPATKYAGRHSTSAEPTAERKLERPPTAADAADVADAAGVADAADAAAVGPAPRDRAKPVKVALASTPNTARAAAPSVPSQATPSVSARASDRVRDGLFAISLALGFSSRRLTLTRPDAAPNGRYEGAPYPEVTAGVSAFPLGLLTDSAWRNLGVSLRYSQDVSASSKEGNASKQLKTASRELLIDLQLRWTFHAGKLPLHFRGSVGWGMRDFSIDENDALTSLRYRFARVAGALRVPLGTPLLCLGFSADVRAIFSVGEEALRSLGTRTGGAIAYALSPGLSGTTKMGLFYFANFEFLQFGATFVGLEPGTARENSADTEATTHSTDRFMRFWIGGGYAF